MKKRKKLAWILAVLIVTAFTALVYGYKEFNRKNNSVYSQKADFKISAAQLVKEFAANEKTATVTYNGKILEVDGIVKSIEQDEKGFYTLVVGDEKSLSSIRCSMDTAYIPAPAFKIQQTIIQLKGICTGYLADDMGLGSDVILNRCIILNGK